MPSDDSWIVESTNCQVETSWTELKRVYLTELVYVFSPRNSSLAHIITALWFTQTCRQEVPHARVNMTSERFLFLQETCEFGEWKLWFPIGIPQTNPVTHHPHFPTCDTVAVFPNSSFHVSTAMVHPTGPTQLCWMLWPSRRQSVCPLGAN
jgi:hypothetical protein